MIIILLNLLVWFPAVAGYGSIHCFLRNRFSSHSTYAQYQVAEPFLGVMVIATIVSLLNFFFGITPTVVIFLLLIGWGFCWFRISKAKFARRWFLFLLLWMIFVSFWATQKPRNPDSGLYHIQAIRWINENPVPLGLANLHQRLGFNTVWFPFAAGLTLPLVEIKQVNTFSASALLIYLFGIAVAQALYALQKGKVPALHHLFLSLSALVIIGNVVRKNISSPSPDFAVLILCILLIYFALETLDKQDDWTFPCLQLILFALFAVTIKFSAVPLLLIPLTVLILGRYKRIALSWKRLFAYSLLFGGSMVAIWLARGIALSGCLAFPIAQSCFENFSWSVPGSIAKQEWLWDQATARTLIKPVISGWDWLLPWFSLNMRSIDFVLPIVLIPAALALLLNGRFASPGLWLSIPLLIALIFWFFTAPDIRFAAGYFWALSILMLSIVIEKYFREKHSVFKILILFVLLILAVIFTLRSNMYLGLPPVLQAVRNGTKFLVTLPVIESQIQTRFTSDGVPIYLPVEGQDCWFSGIPCTPFLHENLHVEKSSNGDFVKFYFP